MEDRIRKFQKKKAGANDGLYTFEIVTGALGILKDGTSSDRVRKGFKREKKSVEISNMMGAGGDRLLGWVWSGTFILRKNAFFLKLLRIMPEACVFPIWQF